MHVTEVGDCSIFYVLLLPLQLMDKLGSLEPLKICLVESETRLRHTTW